MQRTGAPKWRPENARQAGRRSRRRAWRPRTSYPPSQARQGWACAPLYRSWGRFAAGAGPIQPAECGAVDPVLPYKHPGHSSGSALFRKGTFGADNRKRGRSLYYCTVYGPVGPNGGPKMSATPAGGLALDSSGRAHHSHLSSLARDGFAHLCTDFGVGLAPGQASSSPLSAEPSIR